MRAANVVHLIVMLLVGVAVVTRWQAIRRDSGDPAKRAVFLGLLLLEVAFALGLPPIYRGVFRVLGEVPALPQLLQHAALIGACHYATTFARESVEPGTPRPRWHRWVLPGALVSLVGLYLLGPLRRGELSQGWQGSDDPLVIGYVMTWLACCTWAVGDVLMLAWRNRMIRPAPMRLGLRLVGIGCLLGMAHTAHKVLYLALGLLHITVPWDESGPDGLQIFLLAPSFTCIAAGMLITAQSSRIARRRQRRRLIASLAPLADVARAVMSGTASRSRDTPHSQVIVIRDALVGPLRSYLDDVVYRRAHAAALEAGHDAEEAAVRAEAACVDAAVRECGTALTGRRAVPPMTYAADLDSDALWLARVSAALVELRSRADGHVVVDRR
ncbi:hypothetical protein GCM10022243_15800 [Saccharothrix violaceirubra]|uniref:DUF6545 domain-containing protein n=1 Tax=Saccharothrix violaceirubra TaxID=413306 RepID=A0A7W7WXS6_9PSEU|nr:MAB_1171c family putative transporter [Saccharothrix violaceirubra]MBB4967457.1 hypothetical protein [Saccharothrix violaceirubra]